MPANKQRLTITVDPRLAAAGQQAVADGKADSLSGWVSDAIEDKIDRDNKLEYLARAIADFEAQNGTITDTEISAQRRADRTNATVVRGAAKSA